nr:MAG TPA: hypothetical protein [Caudoviricetes sp.]
MYITNYPVLEFCRKIECTSTAECTKSLLVSTLGATAI